MLYCIHLSVTKGYYEPEWEHTGFALCSDSDIQD